MTREQCAYMTAAYPTLDGDDTCFEHRHEPRVFALAAAFAMALQPEPITDEKVAWFLNDADAVVDDFYPVPVVWTIEDRGEPGRNDPGIDKVMAINGVEYVLPKSEYDPAVPVKRETWESWLDNAEDDS